MEEISTKDAIVNILINLVAIALVLLGFTLLFMFAWNIGVVHLIPSFNEIPFLNGLALVVGGGIVHLLAKYWFNKFLQARQQSIVLKAMDKGRWEDLD